MSGLASKRPSVQFGAVEQYDVVRTTRASGGINFTTVLVERAASAAGDGKNEFTIPVIALVADTAGQSQVWVVNQKDNSVHKRDVKTGPLKGSQEVRILSGLEVGEMIAISGVSRLREGMVIRPIDKVEF